MKTHIRVLKGESLRAVLKDELAANAKFGGNDRRFVAFAARELSRHQRLLDWAMKRSGQAPSDWHMTEDQAVLRYVVWRSLVESVPWVQLKNEVALPGPVRPRTVHDRVLEEVAQKSQALISELATLEPATRHSLPTWLVERVAGTVRPEHQDALFAGLSREPPLLLRVRPPGGASAVGDMLRGLDIETFHVPGVRDALQVKDASHRVFDVAPFRQGRLQVQDVGSQLIVSLCQPDRGFAGARIVDLCAGAGGKTLALADEVGKAGRVEAHDTALGRLKEARRRVAEWKLSQVHFTASPALDQADVVLIDAPCSGTGSLAREPDQKWKLTLKAVNGWVTTQRDLLHATAQRVKRGALVVYATCSLLPDENDAQVESFLKAHPGWKVEPPEHTLGAGHPACDGAFLRVLPHRFPGGGFFAVRLRAPLLD